MKNQINNYSLNEEITIPDGLTLGKTRVGAGLKNGGIYLNDEYIGEISELDDEDRGWSYSVSFNKKPSKEILNFFKSKCVSRSGDDWLSKKLDKADLNFDKYSCIFINGEVVYSPVSYPKVNKIEATKEIKIPGTNIILEKGDKIIYKEAFNADKFESLIPYSMRAKEFTFVNDVLYWITEEIFDINEAKQFAVALNKYTLLKKALIISRYDTNWDYMKDLKDDESTFIDLTANENINKTNEDVLQDEIIFENSNFVFKKHYFIDRRKEEHFDYRVITKRGSLADEYVVEIYVEESWSKPEISENIMIKYGLPGSTLDKSISTFISVLQDAMKFADKVAAYLKIKVINK